MQLSSPTIRMILGTPIALAMLACTVMGVMTQIGLKEDPVVCKAEQPTVRAEAVARPHNIDGPFSLARVSDIRLKSLDIESIIQDPDDAYCDAETAETDALYNSIRNEIAQSHSIPLNYDSQNYLKVNVKKIHVSRQIDIAVTAGTEIGSVSRILWAKKRSITGKVGMPRAQIREAVLHEVRALLRTIAIAKAADFNNIATPVASPTQNSRDAKLFDRLMQTYGKAEPYNWPTIIKPSVQPPSQ